MLAFAFSAALAATPLRLSDALREALEKNPALAAAGAEARAARLAVSPSGALDDPMLMIELWNAPADLSTAPIMVQLSQNLPLGGKRQARRNGATADAAGSAGALAVQLLDLQDEVARTYFELFMADRILEVNAEIHRTAQSMVEASASRVTAGKGEQVELLRAQSEVLKIEGEQEVAGGNRLASAAKLAALLDRQDPSTIGPTLPPSMIELLPALDDLRARAAQSRPELAVAKAKIARAEADLDLARAMRVPDLGLVGAEMHTFGGTGPADFLFAGFSVNLPVFASTKTGPSRDAAKEHLEAARAGLRDVENRIAAEVAEAYAGLTAEQRLVQLHHKLIPLARLTFDSAVSGYVAGKIDFPMVIDSERDLQMHEVDLAMHLAAYEQHAADLERAVGADLGLAAAAQSSTPEHHP